LQPFPRQNNKNWLKIPRIIVMANLGYSGHHTQKPQPQRMKKVALDKTFLNPK